MPRFAITIFMFVLRKRTGFLHIKNAPPPNRVHTIHYSIACGADAARVGCYVGHTDGPLTSHSRDTQFYISNRRKLRPRTSSEKFPDVFGGSCTKGGLATYGNRVASVGCVGCSTDFCTRIITGDSHTYFQGVNV